MMKHKATALPMYNDETITMLRASEDVRDSSRFRTFCDTGMTCIGLVWKIVSEIWLMVLITIMSFGVFDMIFHMANWEKTLNGIHQTIHQGFDHYPTVGSVVVPHHI